MTYSIINIFSTRTLTTIPTTDTDTSTKGLVVYDEDLHKKKDPEFRYEIGHYNTFPTFYSFFFSLYTISRTMKQ